MEWVFLITGFQFASGSILFVESENSFFLEIIFSRLRWDPGICIFASFLGGSDELVLSTIISWL